MGKIFYLWARYASYLTSTPLLSMWVNRRACAASYGVGCQTILASHAISVLVNLLYKSVESLLHVSKG
jgi:hypothetical protein